MQLLAFVLIYPLLWLVSILPFRLLYAVSDRLFFLLYHVVGYRKKTVEDNLKLVFPEKSESERKQITKEFFHHLCDMILEAIKSMNISVEDMRARYKFTNIEVIKAFEAMLYKSPIPREGISCLYLFKAFSNNSFIIYVHLVVCLI